MKTSAKLALLCLPLLGLTLGAGITRITYGTFSGTFFGDGSGLSNVTSGAASIWENDGGVIKPSGTNSQSVSLYWPQEGDSTSNFFSVRSFNGSAAVKLSSPTPGNDSTVNLITGPGNEEVYIQTETGVPMDLWPAQDDGANTIYLFDTITNRNNASGKLFAVANGGSSKFSVANSGTLALGATTNQVTFGGTNPPPASATVRKWISVQVAGETNAYRIPLSE
jgi:hypothetical protein